VPGQAQVRGSLDKEIIRRVIRLHMNEVKYCYEMELTRKSGLEGRVTVRFVVAALGQVLSSVVQSSTLNNPRVEKCVADAVHRWEFPKPVGGGIVIVSYPFNFVSASSEYAPVRAAPRTAWDTAVEILREQSELPIRIAKIARELGAAKQTRPALLAWWLVEHELCSARQPAAAYVVVATLLKQAGLLDDAIRILSEAGPFDPERTASELRRWGQVEDAKRVQALRLRGAQ
jgi:TonB family protein